MANCTRENERKSRSKYDPDDLHKCQLPDGHKGKCEEYPYLKHLGGEAKKVRTKIIRDATKTTGASWKSDDAGPNRISRWTMLLSDDELKPLGINMADLSPIIQKKLREKAATYDDCMKAAKKLTWQAYGMTGAPEPDADTRQYLEPLYGPIVKNSTTCLVCKQPLEFKQFENAKRGKAEIETAHATPREHNDQNIGFAHRECNIAQGNKSLPDFYEWIEGILKRNGRI